MYQYHMSEGPEERWALLQRKLQMMEEEATCASKLMKQTWVVCPARGSAPDRSQITERALPRALPATAAQTTLHSLYLSYAWDQELIHYQLFKGCQAKASQQPESLSRNLTFSFQSGEAKLNVSYLEDVSSQQESVINNQHKCNWSLWTLLYKHIVFTFW